MTRAGTSFWQTRRYFRKPFSSWVYSLCVYLVQPRFLSNWFCCCYFGFRSCEWLNELGVTLSGQSPVSRIASVLCSKLFYRELLPLFVLCSSFFCVSLFALPSLSFKIFCKHADFVRLWLWVLDSLFSSAPVGWYSRIRGPAACGIHLRRHLLSVTPLALSSFP